MQKKTKRQKQKKTVDKDLKDSLILWRQGSFALLRCLFHRDGEFVALICVLGAFVGVLLFWHGVLDVHVGILFYWDGVLVVYAICTEHSLLQSLWKGVRQLEKSMLVVLTALCNACNTQIPRPTFVSPNTKASLSQHPDSRETWYSNVLGWPLHKMSNLPIKLAWLSPPPFGNAMILTAPILEMSVRYDSKSNDCEILSTLA